MFGRNFGIKISEPARVRGRNYINTLLEILLKNNTKQYSDKYDSTKVASICVYLSTLYNVIINYVRFYHFGNKLHIMARNNFNTKQE